MTTNDAYELELETLVDRVGLSDVLEMLANICHGKAEHLSSNWQDAAAARVWTRVAKKLEKFTVEV